MNVWDRKISALAKRVRLSVGRGIVRMISDAAGLQIAQVTLMGNEVRSNVERVQEYGFTSVPLPGAECVAVFVGGDRGHGLIIAVDDRRYRLQGLESGEVAIYTDEGDFIKLGRGRNIEIETMTLNISAPTGVNVTTAQLFVSGNIRANGDIIDNAEDNAVNLSGMRAIFNTHTHGENNGSGDTDTPTQIMG